MAISERKRIANRINAQKSTGPRTVQGKKRSSRNAIFHGVFCVDDVLPGEDAATFGILRDQMLLSLVPQNAMEMSLCERIISCTWRLRRLQTAQLHLYEQRVNDTFEHVCESIEDPLADRLIDEHRDAVEQLPAAAVLMTLFNEDHRGLDRLAAYEQRLDQTIHRCLRQLHILQNPKRPRPKVGEFMMHISSLWKRPQPEPPDKADAAEPGASELDADARGADEVGADEPDVDEPVAQRCIRTSKMENEPTEAAAGEAGEATSDKTQVMPGDVTGDGSENEPTDRWILVHPRSSAGDQAPEGRMLTARGRAP